VNNGEDILRQLGISAVIDVEVVGEVTFDELGLIDGTKDKTNPGPNRRTDPVLRAAKKTLVFLADHGAELRIYWERWSPLTREMVADLILGDVVVEKVITYFGGREDCLLRLTDKGRKMVDRIKGERINATRVA